MVMSLWSRFWRTLYIDDADLEMTDTYVRNSLLSWVEWLIICEQWQQDGDINLSVCSLHTTFTRARNKTACSTYDVAFICLHAERDTDTMTKQ